MAGQSWAPQSPNLASLQAPQTTEHSAYQTKLSTNFNNKPSNAAWTPVSPDINGLQTPQTAYPHSQHPPQFSLDSGWENKNHNFNPPPQSPFTYNYQGQHPQQPTSYPAYYHNQSAMPTTRGQRIKDEDQDWEPEASLNHYSMKQEYSPVDQKPIPSHISKKMDTRGVEVKTKFPTARIKRIMQADEDVGKVAQVTPVVIAKALELFMIQLIQASSDMAKSKGSKKVQTAHMKAAVMQDERFDNLREIMDKVSDVPVKKNGATADSDSDEEGGAATKKRKKSTAGRKKRKGSDDD